MKDNWFLDIDECVVLDKPCGLNAKCENTEPGFTCLCPQGFSGKPDPKVACEQVIIVISSAVFFSFENEQRDVIHRFLYASVLWWENDDVPEI